MIFARFDALAPGESFVLVNSHDPIHLRQSSLVTARVLMTGATWKAISRSGSGGSGSSVSLMSTWATCCEASASVEVSRRGTHRGAVDFVVSALAKYFDLKKSDVATRLDVL